MGTQIHIAGIFFATVDIITAQNACSGPLCVTVVSFATYLPRRQVIAFYKHGQWGVLLR